MGGDDVQVYQGVQGGRTEPYVLRECSSGSCLKRLDMKYIRKIPVMERRHLHVRDRGGFSHLTLFFFFFISPLYVQHSHGHPLGWKTFLRIVDLVIRIVFLNVWELLLGLIWLLDTGKKYGGTIAK